MQAPGQLLHADCIGRHSSLISSTDVLCVACPRFALVFVVFAATDNERVATAAPLPVQCPSYRLVMQKTADLTIGCALHTLSSPANLIYGLTSLPIL